VVVAHSVDEAIAHAREQPPDLIISDMHMPNRNGLEFVELVRDDQQLKSIPFIILSSSVHGGGERDRGLKLGASLFICRPIEPEDLLSEIESLLPGRTRG
jgi:CheY-like chemotaxis protein